MDSIISQIIDGYPVHLYRAAEDTALPLIIYNSYKGNGSDIRRLTLTDCPPHNFLTIEIDNWGDDMSPWFCPSLFPKEKPSRGKADDFLGLLSETIIPWALSRLCAPPTYMGITGYSLAGVFSLYSLYKTAVFSRCASISGALWYPDLPEYMSSNPMKKTPEIIYMSLGDKESRTRHPLLKTVGEKTDMIRKLLRDKGLKVIYESNPGSHFTNAPARCAMAIRCLLTQ